jgi:hypothetical protein
MCQEMMFGNVRGNVPFASLNPDRSSVEIEQAPIVRHVGRETVFGGTGNSHFSFVQDKGFHVTTQLRGFGREEGFDNGHSIHDEV